MFNPEYKDSVEDMCTGHEEIDLERFFLERSDIYPKKQLKGQTKIYGHYEKAVG